MRINVSNGDPGQGTIVETHHSLLNEGHVTTSHRTHHVVTIVIEDAMELEIDLTRDDPDRRVILRSPIGEELEVSLP